MRIKVRFMCVDIPIGLGNGEIEVEEGATVADVVALCATKYNMEMPLKEILESMFLVDTKPVMRDRVLKDNEELTVVRTLAGG